MNRIFFLEYLSMAAPANSEKNSTGVNWSAVTRPNLRGELVKVNTSQDWEVFWIQVPIKDTEEPIKKYLKFLCFNAGKDFKMFIINLLLQINFNTKGNKYQ